MATFDRYTPSTDSRSGSSQAKVRELVGKRIVRLVATGTIPVSVAFIVTSLISGPPSLLLSGLTMLAVGVVAWILHHLGTYRADWVAEAGAAAVVVNQLAGDSLLRPTMAAILLVGLATAVVALIPARSWWVLTLFFLAIVALPLLDESGSPSEGLILGVSFLLVVWLQFAVLQALRSAEDGRQRFYDVLDRLPVPMFHEDFSLVQDEIVELGLSLGDLESRLRGNRAEVCRLVCKIRVVDLNKAARTQFGTKALDPRGRLRPSIVTDENEESFITQILTVASGGHQVESEMSQFGDNDRRLQIEWLSSGDDYRTVLVAIHDVTELWEESRFQRALSESKNRFIATISHELRTPLVSVLGFASELHHGADSLDSETIKEFAGLVVNRGREVANLVDDLLISDPNAIEQLSLELDEFDVTALVADVIQEWDAGTPLDGGMAPVIADDLRVRQVVRNLLTNAGRYGGDDVHVVVRSTDEVVVVDVSDDGEVLVFDESLFEPYVTGRVDRPSGSTGLGLYVSRSLARAMGGDLVHVRENNRTVFRLTLPSATPAEVFDPADGAQPGPGSGPGSNPSATAARRGM